MKTYRLVGYASMPLCGRESLGSAQSGPRLVSDSCCPTHGLEITIDGKPSSHPPVSIPNLVESPLKTPRLVEGHPAVRFLQDI